jgi:hypothetical protein
MKKFQFVGTTTLYHVRINIDKKSYAVTFIGGGKSGHCISKVECEENDEILFEDGIGCISNDLYLEIDKILEKKKNTIYAYYINN